jgi:hypothetical protein
MQRAEREGSIGRRLPEGGLLIDSAKKCVGLNFRVDHFSRSMPSTGVAMLIGSVSDRLRREQ